MTYMRCYVFLSSCIGKCPEEFPNMGPGLCPSVESIKDPNTKIGILLGTSFLPRTGSGYQWLNLVLTCLHTL